MDRHLTGKCPWERRYSGTAGPKTALCNRPYSHWSRSFPLLFTEGYRNGHWDSLECDIAFPGDEALFHCAKPSRVLRGPANSTASLIYQKHTGKFPKFTGKLLLHKVPMKRPTQQDSHRFCLPLKGSKVPSPLLCCLGGHQGAIRIPFPFPS